MKYYYFYAPYIYKGSLFCKYYSIHFFNCLLVLKCLYITSEKQLLMTFCFYYIYQFYLFFCSIFSLNKYFDSHYKHVSMPSIILKPFIVCFMPPSVGESVH